VKERGGERAIEKRMRDEIDGLRMREM